MTAETTPLSDLLSAISTAVQAGARVPCLGPSRDWWTSEEADDLEAARWACQTCPVLALCQTYRDNNRETGAVYAGVLPDRADGKKRTEKKA